VWGEKGWKGIKVFTVTGIKESPVQGGRSTQTGVPPWPVEKLTKKRKGEKKKGGQVSAHARQEITTKTPLWGGR